MKRLLVVLLVVGILTAWAPTPRAMGLLPTPAGAYPTVSVSGFWDLPAKVDLSPSMPPVGDQGGLGSCAAWAAAYYVRSYQEGVQNGYVPRNPNQIMSPAFVYNQRRNDSSGMYFDDAVGILKDHGAASLATMPYDKRDDKTQPTMRARYEASRLKSEGGAALFIGNRADSPKIIKQKLASGIPVIVGVFVYQNFFWAGKEPIGVPESKTLSYGYHAITIVGYDEVTRLFRCVNSWGTNWGDEGYAWLTYDFVREIVWEAWVIYDTDTVAPIAPRTLG